MIKPFTCICLVMAAGSGLYLYQVKQRAFALDADLRGTYHDIDMAREKTRMLRADWALMNDPERLQALSNQYLALKPMGPTQLMTLDQLAANLPAPIPPGTKTAPAEPDLAAPTTDPTHGVPMASTAMPTPTGGATDGTAVAMLQPAAPTPAAPSDMADDGSTPTDNGLAASATANNLAPAEAALKAASAASAAALVAAAVVVPHQAPPAPLPKLAAVVPHATHHATRHLQPAVAKSDIVTADAGALADAGGPSSAAPKAHHNAHHAKPVAPGAGTQYFAANEPSARPAYSADRITPRAATVMYTPAAGSSLGMASAANLAPPRPLYSSTQ